LHLSFLVLFLSFGKEAKRLIKSRKENLSRKVSFSSIKLFRFSAIWLLMSPKKSFNKKKPNLPFSFSAKKETNKLDKFTSMLLNCSIQKIKPWSLKNHWKSVLIKMLNSISHSNVT
jgi:hypothetical protein